MASADRRERIISELAALEDEHGCLTPEAVVHYAAGHTDSALHEMFDWDDQDAAHKWRIEQARELIRSYRVVMQVEEREYKVPVYLRDPRAPGDKQGYVALRVVKCDDDLQRQVIQAELGRALAALERAEAVAVALGDRRAIERVRRLVQAVLRKVTAREEND